MVDEAAKVGQTKLVGTIGDQVPMAAIGQPFANQGFGEVCLGKNQKARIEHARLVIRRFVAFHRHEAIALGPMAAQVGARASYVVVVTGEQKYAALSLTEIDEWR